MKLGLQLFTLFGIMKKPGGLKTVLKMAADAGYDGVEFAGFFDMPIEEVREELDKNNLEAAGYHLNWAPLTLDTLENDPEGVLKIVKTLNMRALVVASFPAKTREEWIAFAQRMDRNGAMLREHGVLLGYHNHRIEAKKLDDEYIIDIIMNNCSAENVFWELDPRHVQIVGTSPVELAAKYCGRVPFLHMRDIEKITGDDTADDAPVGSGIVDIPGVVKASGEHEWLIVEENCCPDIEKHIKMSADYIRASFIK